MAEERTVGGEGPGRERRAALAVAAFHRIARQGFEGLRTRDVAADVGVNIGTLHYYYPSKEDLIRAVLAQAMRRLAAAMPRQGSPGEQLRAHLAAVSRLLADDAEACAVLAEFALRAPRDPVIARITGKMDETWMSTLRALLRRGVEQGDLPAGLDIDGAAALVITAVRGAILPSTDPHRSENIAGTFRQLMSALGLDRPGRKAQC